MVNLFKIPHNDKLMYCLNLGIPPQTLCYSQSKYQGGDEAKGGRLIGKS